MSGRPLLVLVADDDGDVRDALAHVLEEEGMRVALAADGQHALERLAEEREIPCAVLLDWVMPRTDGESFLRARAASESLARIPVFVMSATHSPAGDPRIQGFLPKPFAVEALLPALRAVCDEHCPAPRRAACRHLAPREPGI